MYLGFSIKIGAKTSKIHNSFIITLNFQRVILLGTGNLNVNA
jgi:hypothetical protein